MIPFRISKLEINNIGPFGNIILDFPEKPEGMSDKAEIHILTGENGTGKSTVLELLTSCLLWNSHITYSKLRIKEDTTFFNVYFSDNTNFKCEFDISNGTIVNRGFSSVIYVTNYWKHFRAYSNNAPTPFETAFFAYSGYRRVNQTTISAIQELQNHPFDGALDFQNSINPQLILQWIANVISKEAISKSQSGEQAANRYRNAISQIEQAISSIIEKPVRFILDLEPLDVKIEVDGEKLNFNQLPDGLKSIVSWLSDLLMRMDRVKWVNDTPVFERNFILFLDEIEVHLHPAWQRKILPAIQSLFPNAQIFVSTHSPFVIGSVDGAWIHKLIKPNGDTKLASPPILSEDSHSVSYWLKEVFDIKSEFGQAVQHDLDKFYLLRDKLLINGTPEQRNDLKEISQSLLNQNSQELSTIINLELRQLNKRLATPLNM